MTDWLLTLSRVCDSECMQRCAPDCLSSRTPSRAGAASCSNLLKCPKATGFQHIKAVRAAQEFAANVKPLKSASQSLPPQASG